MIGVVFALQETFGTTCDIEGTAFVRAVRTFADSRNVRYDAAATEDALLRAEQKSSLPDLNVAFSNALTPYPLSRAEHAELADAFEREALRLVMTTFTPFEDVVPTLGELAKLNVPRAALSGGRSSIDACKARLVGFSGATIFAEDLRTAAASPAAFALVCKTLHLPADRIWFAGTDVCSEIAPAGAAGMRTIWLNRRSEPLPVGRTAPSAIVTSFAEILDVVSESYTRGLLALRDILRSTLGAGPERGR